MIRKGDRFIQTHPDARWPVFIEVTRVGKSGWVDIQCCTWAVSWTKRMPEGLKQLLAEDSPYRIVRKAWTWDEVRATEPEVPA